jgi:hypothetical protein
MSTFAAWIERTAPDRSIVVWRSGSAITEFAIRRSGVGLSSFIAGR